jgi:TatD DNase family protein
MNYFDVHTHTNFFAYDADREAVIDRAREAGVGINLVGTQRDTSLSAIALAEKYDDVYATIGLHPIHTDKSYHDEQEIGEGGAAFTSRGEVFDMSVYEAMARHPKVIAIGECGLDYFRCDESTKTKQKDAFVQQIELANKVGKPLMLHIRPSDKKSSDAYDDALELIKSYARVAGDAHFFVGNWETAKKFLDLGFSFSFNGVLTFTHDYDEVVKNIPLDKILSETDAPYLAPVPFRGKRNEPMHVTEVVRAIARIKEMPEGEVAEQILQNTKRVFNMA